MARNPMTPFRPGGGMFPGDPFLSLHREMNRLFDDVFRGIGLPAATGSQGQGDVSTFVNASMNVSETDKEIRITAELPGVSEQDIDVSLDDDVLTIRGEKKFERKDDKENFHFVERSYGTFQRSLRLPYRRRLRAGSGQLRERRADRNGTEDRTAGALPSHPGSRTGRTQSGHGWRKRRTANIQPIGPIPGHEIELNVGRVMGTAVVHLGEVPAAPISRSTSFSKARFWVATKRR